MIGVTDWKVDGVNNGRPSNQACCVSVGHTFLVFS